MLSRRVAVSLTQRDMCRIALQGRLIIGWESRQIRDKIR